MNGPEGRNESVQRERGALFRVHSRLQTDQSCASLFKKPLTALQKSRLGKLLL